MKSVVAKSSDGSIQVTFTIPWTEIKKAQEETVSEMAPNVEVSGFRKGKAPLEKVREKIPQNTLIEHSLGHVLPEALAEAIKEHKLKIAIYPKYELVSIKDGEDWQVRAISCELPEILLPDYKKEVAGEIRAASLKKELSRDEKEQVVIKYLIEKVKISLPKVLVDEEVNSRLSQLLARIEKLGLVFESYLASIKKTPEELRAEYQSQASDAISIDLILSKIVESESITVSDTEIDEAVKTTGTKEANRDVISGILKKRKALEFLINLS